MAAIALIRMGVETVGAYYEYVDRIAQSPAVYSTAEVPWKECYPSEDFSRPDYPLLVTLVASLAPQLDPSMDTWRPYGEFLEEHSYLGPTGDVWTYVVPDVDGNGQVCGIPIGEWGAWPAEQP